MTLETHVRHLLESSRQSQAAIDAHGFLRALERFADRSPEGAVAIASLAGDAHRLDPGDYPGFKAGPRGCVVIEPRR
jgi:hypothetical protein